MQQWETGVESQTDALPDPADMRDEGPTAPLVLGRSKDTQEEEQSGGRRKEARCGSLVWPPCLAYRPHATPAGEPTGSSAGSKHLQSLLQATLELALVVSACYGFDWLFHNPYCGLLFQCACTWNWRGGWAKCNVHNANKPWCPWCRAPQDNPTWAFTVSDAFTITLMTIVYVCTLFWTFHRHLHRADLGVEEHQQGQREAHDETQRHRRERTSAWAVKEAHGLTEYEKGTEELGEGNALKEQRTEGWRQDDEENPGGPSRNSEATPALFRQLDCCVPCHSQQVAQLLQEEQGRVQEQVWQAAWRARARASVASVAVFFVYGLSIGLVFWLATDYPYFLFLNKGTAYR